MAKKAKYKMSDLSIHAWMLEHQIKNEKGDPIEFRNHLFLFHIYNDESPNLVVMKPAQVGLSTAEIIRMFYFAAKRKMDFIYTLPTDDDVKKFVGGKVNRIIDQNPILQQYTQDKDTIEQKKVGNSMIYFNGAFLGRKAIMITADVLMHDEKDSSDQQVISDYRARTEHSKYKWRHVFSHPSVPGHGVHVEWEQSDQKHWFIHCPHEGCKKRHFMQWPESVNIKDKKYICKYCKGDLSDKERTRGRWVSKYKNRKYSGYWINQMMCSWISAEDLVEKFNDPNMTTEFFYNKILGLPYEGEGNTVQRTDILRNCTAQINAQDNVIIGADSGLTKHYVLGNKEGIFHYGKTDDWEDITDFLDRFPKSILVVDALPDLTEPRRIQQKYPGRVYLCHYSRDRKTQQLIRWGKKDEDGTVNADRNRVIQLLIDEFKQMRVPLQGKAAEWEDYVKHYLNIYRTKELDSMDRPVFIWNKKNTEDHWVHATVYWRIGMSRFGDSFGQVTGGEQDNALKVRSGVEIDPITKDIPSPDLKQVFQFQEPELDDWRYMG